MRKKGHYLKEKPPAANAVGPVSSPEYERLVSDISDLLERARRTAARSVNNILTVTYWEIGRRIVEHEQGGQPRAGYGEELLVRLSQDLSAKYGRGFSRQGLQKMRAFYLGWQICPTPSGKLEARAIFPTVSVKSENKISQTLSAEINPPPVTGKTLDPASVVITSAFLLSWSHYVRLLAVEKPQARTFYETEAIRGGWSVRQLDRQITTQFYERAVRSKQPGAMIDRGQKPIPQDTVTAEEEVRDPYLLEFLNLRDEYSESDMEEALIRHLEWFLLEMGTGFTFVARQKRIRVGESWYRIDLLLFHRVLRCLIVIDLKTEAFTHADAGQMNLYLNYTREHLMMPGEADPIGIILCSDKDDAVVKYATGGITARVFASKYLTDLPDEETLRREILVTQRALATRLPQKGE
jgi:predicted nuclease of restriction endonuclease-like (RecB) superfamily